MISVYQDKRGKIPFNDWMDDMKHRDESVYHKIEDMLSQMETGTLRLERPNVKKMLARCDYRNLYKIRLGKYRLFFIVENGDYKLLHTFRKSSNATPEKEVKRVSREIEDGYYIALKKD